MRRPTILVADDHAVFVDGIVSLLRDRFEIVGRVKDGAALLEAANRLHPDAIVMDLSMPGMSGLEVLRRLNQAHSTARVVILTMHTDARLAAEAVRLGAKGFVLKDCSGEDLVTAIEAALRGHTYLAVQLTEEVLALAAAPAAENGVHLTPRQREVLRLIVSGQRMKEIAAVLGLSPRTVETTKYEMMRTLNVHSTTELVRYAIERGLVSF
jgi:DNA-binding NarL/FixJ family response regulator